MNIFKSIILLIIISLSQNSLAQKDMELDSLEIAEAFLQTENFSHAIGFYKRFLQMNPDDPEMNFKLGFCLLNTPTGKEEAIKYLTVAVKRYKRKKGKRSVQYIESYFYLARAYRAVYKYDEAIAMFNELDGKIKSRRLKKEIELEMKLCRDGKEIYDNALNITLINLGDSINSIYSDHSPVYTADETVLIFTSRRENTSGGEADMDGMYDEDIFISHKVNGKWTKPKGISKNINTPEHEASIGLSLDGKTLLLYKGEDEGSIYMSSKQGDDWSKPVKLGENINTKRRETHASLSADGRFLYFTSERKSGYGGLDIYVSEIQEDGTWGVAKNLGPAVNTESDEEGPYIHPDGKTLYFSSEGHKNLGGFDIFKTEKNEFGTWKKCTNVGYPINTVEDDVFFIPSPNGKRVYLSSYRPGGMGDNDIYLINLDDAEDNALTVVSSKVYAKCSNKDLHANITLTDLTTGDETYYTPNQYNGSFVLVLEKEKPYALSAKVAEKIVFQDSLFYASDTPYKITYDSIRTDPFDNCGKLSPEDSIIIADLTDEKGIVYDETITIGNVLFGYAADDYIPTPAVDSLIRFLADNPNTRIRIKAFADSRGSALSNYYLSIKRGNAVKEYFKSRGIKDRQIEVKGYGEENPIARNILKGRYNPEGQKYNRRVEFEIIQQGTRTILLKFKPEIPEKHRNPNYQKDYKKNKRNDIETRI